MIHLITFVNTPDSLMATGLGGDARNPWVEMQKVLDKTKDTIVFIITRRQMDHYVPLMEKYDLFKYAVVDHRNVGAMERGSANRNYSDDPHKLKVFVLKGKGESNA